MNKHIYRIIFNKKRGQLMAVAETATGDGKAAGGTRRAGGVAAPYLAAMRPLHFHCLPQESKGPGGQI
jgi:filamentous hemagglutinin